MTKDKNKSSIGYGLNLLHDYNKKTEANSDNIIYIANEDQ